VSESHEPFDPVESAMLDRQIAKAEAAAAESRADEDRFTDLFNCRLFANEWRASVRYSYDRNAWLVFDGRRWSPDRAAIENRAKTTVENLHKIALTIRDEDRRRRFRAHALKSEQAGRISSMLELARSEPGIPVEERKLDADPWVLNAQNGTIDLRLGELWPHRPEDLITRIVPVDYDAGARCPRWEAFIAWAMQGDRQLIHFLQRAVGYSISGSTAEQVLFMPHGGGGNGKSTFLETLQHVFGDYALSTPPDTLLAKRLDNIPNDVARLEGARFVVAIEAEEGRRLAEAKLKMLTGGDTVTARFLHREFRQFRPTFKLWFGVNHKPEIRGTDHAIWRRIRLIPFSTTIADAERDPNLVEKLRAEAPGILAWAVQGCMAWQFEGLAPPVAVLEATSEYRRESDETQRFIDERCIVGKHESCRAGELFKAYCTWAEQEGLKPMSQTAVGRRLTEKGFAKREDSKGNIRQGLRPRADDLYGAES
jgi:putative DNA primase/helicase